jgi:hypothetical protein
MYERVEIGMNRSDVILLLGAPSPLLSNPRAPHSEWEPAFPFAENLEWWKAGGNVRIRVFFDERDFVVGKRYDLFRAGKWHMRYVGDDREIHTWTDRE